VNERVNGFAEGDRVAIVNCEYAGAYGKVVRSYDGCVPEDCRQDCYLVVVRLMSKPPGVEAFEHRRRQIYFPYEGGGDVKRFLVSEVTHVD
jgi:hypothetical protein